MTALPTYFGLFCEQVFALRETNLHDGFVRLVNSDESGKQLGTKEAKTLLAAPSADDDEFRRILRIVWDNVPRYIEVAGLHHYLGLDSTPSKGTERTCLSHLAVVLKFPKARTMHQRLVDAFPDEADRDRLVRILSALYRIHAKATAASTK
jgi:hypothetical protein